MSPTRQFWIAVSILFALIATGAVVAISRPGKRPGNALACPVELRKQP